MSRRTQAVLFDLDGTLIDSLADLAAAMNAVLEEAGLPVHPTDAYRHFIGDGITELVMRALPPAERAGPHFRRYLQRYRESYEQRWHRSPVFPGIDELLRTLSKRGVGTAVISNKPDSFTQKCVRTLLPDACFDVIVGHSDAFPRKPDPASTLEATKRLGVSPSDCFFVGDSDVDMQTGGRAAMTTVGVTWGFRSRAELLAAGAHHLIKHPLELLALLSDERQPAHAESSAHSGD